MEWKFCDDVWVWKINWKGMGRDGNEICGDGCNFCPRAGRHSDVTVLVLGKECNVKRCKDNGFLPRRTL